MKNTNNKLTKKEIVEFADGRPIVKAGFCCITPLLEAMAQEGKAEKIGHTEGVYGWNADVWDAGAVVIVEGYRPFGQVAVTGYHKKTLKRQGPSAALADALSGAFSELKGWGLSLPAKDRNKGYAKWEMVLLRDLICAKIKQGEEAKYSASIRPVRQIGTGKKGYKPYYADEGPAIKLAARALGLSIEEGNDAPRGGRLGDYIVVKNY